MDHEFATDTNDRDELKACIALLSRRISRDLLHRRSHPRGLDLCLSYADGIQHHGRCTQIHTHDLFMFSQAWDLFGQTWKRRTRIRHISLACSTVPFRTEQASSPAQADLFQAPEKNEKTLKIRMVQGVLSQVMERFGPGAITLGTALKMPAETAVP